MEKWHYGSNEMESIRVNGPGLAQTVALVLDQVFITEHLSRLM